MVGRRVVLLHHEELLQRTHRTEPTGPTSAAHGVETGGVVSGGVVGGGGDGNGLLGRGWPGITPKNGAGLVVGPCAAGRAGHGWCVRPFSVT